MKVLVTGSSGFIGATLVSSLEQAGHEVGGLDRRLPQGHPPKGGFALCDLLDVGLLQQAIAKFQPEAILHLAARTGIKEVPPDNPHYAANTIGTLNLMAAARQCGTVRRILFTSTKYVHRGALPAHDRDYQPTTSYGLSKAKMEELVWEQDGGCAEWCIVRPTTVWGPGMGAHYQRFLRMLAKGWYFHIGRREVRKHMSYVGNIVFQYQHLLMAEADRIHRKVFYLTDYEPVVLREWAELLREGLGGPPIRTLPMGPARILAWMGDIIAHCGWRKFPLTSFRLRNLTEDDLCSPELTERTCGPLPFSLEQAAQQTALWFQQQREKTKN